MFTLTLEVSNVNRESESSLNEAQDTTEKRPLYPSDSSNKADTGIDPVIDAELSFNISAFEALDIPMHSDESRKRSRRTFVLTLLGFSVALSVIVLVILAVYNEIDYSYGITINDVQIPLAAPGDEDYQAFVFHENVVIADSQNAAYALELINPEENSYKVVFELTLKETGELLFESKLTEPGERLTDITLSRTLPRGEHKAILTIRSYEDVTCEIINKTEIVFQLKID